MKTLEFEALKSVCAHAAVDPRDAAQMLDESGVKASDLQDLALQRLWLAVETTIRAGDRLDAVSLAIRAHMPNAAVADIVLNGTPGTGPERLRMVREASMRRQYLEALRTVARVVTDEASPLSNAVAEAAKLLSAWQDETTSARTLDSSLLALVDELEAVAQGRLRSTVPTGIEALDAVIGGLQPTLTIVGALPGVGKSALVAGICRMLALRKTSVGVLSLEDDANWLTRRLLAHLSSVPVFVLANRPMAPSQQRRVSEVVTDLQQMLAHIHVDDRPGLTTADVVASARRMVARGAKAIIVDHLGEVRIERSERHDLDISDCLRELRTVAKTARVPVVVLAHLRRREGLSVDTEPRLTDFAFSSGVERMARVALGLWRSGEDLHCTVLKQTQGVSGVTVRLRMNPQAGLVVESPSAPAVAKVYGDEVPE